MSEHVLPAEEPIRFVAPIIQDNPTGWGPAEMPEQFRDMPYQPFSKGDRLGKISDWTVVQDKKYQSKFIALSCLIYKSQIISQHYVSLRL